MLFSPEAVAAIQCYQCHGTSGPPVDYRPLDAAQRNISSGGFVGSHRTHMGTNATPASCTACHGNGVYLSNHRNNGIDMVANINNSPKVGEATYSKGVFFNQTSMPIPGTCSNVNCHFEQVTPAWGGAPFTSPNDCNQCHGAPPTGGAAGAAGAAGSHATHDTYYSGAANCAKCHADHTIEANPFIHATSAGKRSLNISFSAAPNNGSGAYDGALNDYLPSQNPTGTAGFGTCSNLYCHSPGTKAVPNFTAPNQPATWGGTLTCKGCHNAEAFSGAEMSTGSHLSHVKNTMSTTTIKCVTCHAVTANANMTISDVNRHVNSSVEIAFNNTSSAANGSYNGSPATKLSPSVKVPGSPVGSCQNVYCHSAGQHNDGTALVAGDYTTPVWNSSLTGQCGTCHAVGGTNEHGGWPGYVKAGPAIASGSHTKHLSYSYGITSADMQCAICHTYDKTAFTSKFTSCDTACHGGPPNNTAFKHANYEINVNIANYFGATGTYNGTTKPGDGYSSCSNVSCHYNTTTPAWGTATPINCVGCHTLAVLLASGSHAKHISATAIPTMYNYTANRSTSSEYDFGCSNCHPLILTNHTNNSINVTLKKDEAGVGSLRAKNSATAIGINVANSGMTGTSKTSVVCTAAYCHSNGNAAALVYAVTPDWYGGSFTNPDRCANCHGNAPNSTIAGSKAHYNNRFLGYTSNPGGHQIGIHAMKIYSSPAGLAHAGTASSSSHGNSGTSTTISCNICHYDTITTARNDNNGVCKTCHVSGNAVGATFGNPVAIANKAKHVNGTVDVAFQPVTILSKAQMRQSYFAIAAYSSAWKRNGGYKSNGGHDSAKLPLNTATMWNSGTKTCSNVACHNGQSVK